ncbi:MAG: hypothetical protein HZC41_05120 [Chloroflexi bacterium]|nr:hypothetical protein [Chloroflexota bacterium]
MKEQSAGAFIEALTRREMDVLTLLAEGLSNQEIAASLVMEVGTVKWYNTQIYNKLQVKNRKQAVTRALTLGILEADTGDPRQQPQHNLPADTLPFIGRRREINELVQQLTSDKFRLITILGPGGMGKTRFSIEVGRHLLGYFRDGVYFVPLAAVTSAEHLVTAIADVIGFKFHSDLPPKQQLLDYLQKQHMLLLMDNFEHLLEYAGFLTDILRSAPDVKVLVTSREKLGLSGEVVYVIGGLSVPFDESADIVAHDAVKLFMEAANRTISPMTEADITTVARICRMLGGMPLAILLAAAWVDTLSLAEIEAEIKSGLNILEATLRDAPPRHQSIEAVFDYSWKRLTTNEQMVFRRLSVFRDGFTREAAQAVAAAKIHDLQRLVHTSFLQHLPSERYAIHELMRQYGEQKLNESGELERVRQKHADYFAGLIAPVGELVWLMVTPDVLERVNADFENVRAAWHVYLERKDSGGLRQLLDGIWHFLDQSSRSQEAIDLFEAALDRFDGESGDDVTLFRGQVLGALGWFYNDIGRGTKAIELTQEAITILQPFGITSSLLQAYVGLGIMLFFANRLQEAMDVFERGFALSRGTNEQKWWPILCNQIGAVNIQLGQYQQALTWLQQVEGYHFSLVPIGEVLHKLGEYARAEEVLLKSLGQVGWHRYYNALSYSLLIENAVHMEQYEKAWRYLQRGLQYVDDEAYAWAALDFLQSVVGLFKGEKQYQKAVELLSLIVHHPHTIAFSRAQAAQDENTLRALLAEDEFAAAWERGKHLNLGAVITELMEQ